MKKQYNTLIFLLFAILIFWNNNVKANDDEDNNDDNQQIDFSYYHTTQKIFDEMDDISKNCNDLITISKLNSDPDLRVVNFNTGKNKEFKSFLLFGEHPREMISPETGLHLLKALCKKTNEDFIDVDFIKENYELKIMVNANPISRQQVEQGDFCKRQNENNVDINRNYDAHWEFIKDDYQQVSSGEKPFSEIQTQKIRDILAEFQPHYFLTVHSGTYGLYTPYAYEKKKGSYNEDNMMSIMLNIKDTYCNQCHVGSAAKEVGYLCPGTCLDYAYDSQKVKYSFAIEIYNKQHADMELIQLKSSQNKNKIQTNAKSDSCFAQFSIQNYDDKYVQKNKINNNLRRIKDQDEDQLSTKKNFLKMQSKTKNKEKLIFGSEYEKCFLFFNPGTKDQYDSTVSTWTKAILQSMKMTVGLEKNNKKAQTTAPGS